MIDFIEKEREKMTFYTSVQFEQDIHILLL